MAVLESNSSCCTHRWKIASPVGEACNGICLLCGAVRNFTNQRFPFGQPAKVRKTVPPVRSGGRVEVGGGASMSAFLLQHRSSLNEASLPD